ncbi:MAG: histidinol dehydrogenase [Ignavibacteriae bacterium]|nr:histidinol dehydrogenase [Ignavibacteriota bacterium]
MKKIVNPEKQHWVELSKRPIKSSQDLEKIVYSIFENIRENGDKALLEYTSLFDNVTLNSIVVEYQKIEDALNTVSLELKEAIALAKGNIEKFHASQIQEKKIIETTKGVKCWRENRPIEKIGIYIPGGSAPLFSTVLMLGIPAILAGCKEIVLCTPPGSNGEIDPAILFTANLIGIKSIFRVGGIQAIGALTFGTESISKVDKIFGPGNQYVTAAKQIAQRYGVAIDLPAGPSEVLVIADKYCNPEFVAADLLSQAEHGADSQVILLSDNEQVILDTIACLEEQLDTLPRKDIIEAAMKNSKAILLKNLHDCIEFSNVFAPEHLLLSIEYPESLIDKINNAGSVFLGNYSCESAGDYASGTNHTLPTNGYARNYSGVSIDSFVKKITFQELSKEGLHNIGSVIEIMAEAEQLIAHKNAVTIRLKTL